MDDLEDQLAKLNILNSKPLASSYTKTSHTISKNICNEETIVSKSGIGKVAALVSDLEDCNLSKPTTNISNNGTGAVAVTNTKCLGQGTISPKKVGPIVPPKPHKKKHSFPEVPQSSQVKQVCEPLYSQRLQSLDNIPANSNKNIKQNTSSIIPGRLAILQRKQPIYATQNSLYDKTSKVTLDNPAILEQQLEALAHHKKQLEKKGLLAQHQEDPKQEKSYSRLSSCIPKLSSISLVNDVRPINNEHSNVIYTNLRQKDDVGFNNVYNNVNAQCNNRHQYNETQGMNVLPSAARNNIYSNVLFKNDTSDDLLPQPPAVFSIAEIDDSEYLNNTGGVNDDEVPPPPSPVSSSYSELRRATDVSSKKQNTTNNQECNETVSNDCYPHHHYDENEKAKNDESRQTYMNMNYSNNGYSSYSPTLQIISQDSDYYGYGSLSQASSTYESIYEPINPRPPSQLSSRSNYLMYAPYMDGPKMMESGSGGMLCNSDNSSTNLLSLGNMHTSGPKIPIYPSGDSSNGKIHTNNQKETEVESLTDFLVHSMDTANDVDSYGICYKCNERVLGENSGCTAMDQIYHIACFTCSQCQINLQGKPFYALENKPFCEYDYLQTLEKCSVCMKPILERILRATGKPYHPQCFTCIVCSNSLDGIPFTVDATNQNYCIADFHKKFAPRCCVCKEPIMPEPGEEETVRVVALDRSFHFECYKCEDCGLLLSSEAEGRGCYPLDDHVLCKSCNAERVQMLTNRMTTEL